ncbi:MAG: hypothetical protein AVDCRST_MAG23-2229 [uncultured Sphingosinicella sp.]|uniref:Uncharacterized protein n=1 Tax=uncultured Sphingosinicella sp. TaxID=478748 RepID=A0A6J4U6Z6_9SPHN|nr:MAG: hypothetical protein AVDCRST_MAG23-2229 [uncultured Sphingosinicella sp.]
MSAGSDFAGEYREQAAACRRLATRARTSAGASALSGIATRYETEADRLDALPSPAGPTISS